VLGDDEAAVQGKWQVYRPLVLIDGEFAGKHIAVDDGGEPRGNSTSVLALIDYR
jgi:hypothetical protein